MLNFHPFETEKEKRNQTTQIRHGESLGALIAQAAQRLAVDKSVFLRSAIAKEAERVLSESTRHVLTPEEAAQFAAALDTPPAPTPRALAGRTAYEARIVHAD